MTEETTPYDLRADHGKRAALMRLRLVEEQAVARLGQLAEIRPSCNARDVAAELSAAIDGLVNTMRQTQEGK